MADQYVASDKRTGVEVSVTGEFPPHPDDRMRIARMTTLFTRLMSTLLATENESERRAGFRAVETQLELADALIRRDTDDVRRLVRQTMESMGVTQDQLQDLARQLHDLSGLDDATADQLTRALGLDPPEEGPDDGRDVLDAETGDPASDAKPGAWGDWPPPPGSEPPGEGPPSEGPGGGDDDSGSGEEPPTLV